MDSSVGLTDDYAWPVAMHNGVHQRDGTIRYNGHIDSLEVEVTTP